MQRAVLPASGSNALVIAGDTCTVARQSEVAWFFGSHYTGDCLSIKQGGQFCGAAAQHAIFCTLTSSPICHSVKAVGKLFSAAIRQTADLQQLPSAREVK